MSGRPEGENNSHDYVEPYDRDAWQEFTPWRPGDPSPRDESPSAEFASQGFFGGGRSSSWTTDPSSETKDSESKSGGTIGRPTTPGGRWWTEDHPRRYEGGERVRSRHSVGGDFIKHVPERTHGRVTSTRMGMFGDEYVTVEFDNGYTEEVRPDDIKRDSWW